MADPAPPAASDQTAADPSADAGASTDAGGDNGTVLLTVMDMGDGTYKLVAGDEDESGEPDAGAAADATGAAPAATGKSYDSVGALLKGILDLVKAHEESAGGEGTADDQFSAGFAGGSDASPTKPSMAQKY